MIKRHFRVATDLMQNIPDEQVQQTQLTRHQGKVWSGWMDEKQFCDTFCWYLKPPYKLLGLEIKEEITGKDAEIVAHLIYKGDYFGNEDEKKESLSTKELIEKISK